MRCRDVVRIDDAIHVSILEVVLNGRQELCIACTFGVCFKTFVGNFYVYGEAFMSKVLSFLGP